MRRFPIHAPLAMLPSGSPATPSCEPNAVR